MKWVVESLRDNRYVIRPENCLGTCGWIDGKPWTCKFVTGLQKANREAAKLNNMEQSNARSIHSSNVVQLSPAPSQQ